jgi:hypothetical protein
MKYYKATLQLETEQMEFDTKEQAYIDYDPETRVCQGVINVAVGDTIEEAVDNLMMRQGYDLPKDAVLIDGRIEFQNDGEHHYNTPEEEQIPFREIWYISVRLIETVELESFRNLEVE